jgi:hypothetical protein
MLKVALNSWLIAQVCLGCFVSCSRLPWMHGFPLKVTLDALLPAQVALDA